MEAAQLLFRAIQLEGFREGFKSWQKARDERIAAEARRDVKVVRFDPPVPPAVVIALIVCLSPILMGGSCGKVAIKDAADLQIYCCDPVEGHPVACVGLPVPVPCGGYVPHATPTPRAQPTAQPPGPICVTGKPLCDCWLWLNESWISQACPTPATPTPTSTPVPMAAPTATPMPTPAPTDACVDVSRLPVQPVPALRTGSCPSGLRRLDIGGTGQHVCVADWRCINDSDDSHNCWNRAQKDVNEFHHWVVGPDGYFSSGEHYRKDAYCRPVDENGNIHQPGVQPDGRVPYSWEYEGICQPAVCEATPVPTATPTAVPSPTPIEGPGHGCRLPVGEGDGQNCPRTSSQLLVQETAALDKVIAAHSSWVSGNIVLPTHENDFRYAVAAQLVSDGLCAFFDGEEVAVKNSNAFSEQYAVLSSSNNIRRGENSYRATCSPAWSRIPGPTAEPVAETPLLVKIRVGDHCQNPKDGPKYANGICIVTTTGVYRNPRRPEDNQHDSPCDREPALTDFCNRESQDDPRGVLYTIAGAADLGLDPDNPQQIEVRFTPGVEFTVCASPYPDAHNARGQAVRALGDPSSCTSQTQ